jgi:hypothetical protein
MCRNAIFRRPLAVSVLLVLAGAQATVANAGGVKSIKLLPATVNFKPGPNLALVQETCLECHSADYVVYQPRQSVAGWKAVIDKMRDSMHMDPLTPDQEAKILDYLVTSYGQ